MPSGWQPSSGAATAATRHARGKTDVQFARSFSSRPPTAERRPLQPSPDPATSGLGSVIAATTTRHAGGNQGIGARRRAAVVAARLQRDIGGGATGPSSPACAGMHFGMRLAGLFVPAFADDVTVIGPAERRGLGEVVPQARSAVAGRAPSCVINGGKTFAAGFSWRGRLRGWRENASTSSKLRETEAKRI